MLSFLLFHSGISDTLNNGKKRLYGFSFFLILIKYSTNSQVEVSTSGSSLVWKIPTKYGVSSECDRETTIQKNKIETPYNKQIFN